MSPRCRNLAPIVVFSPSPLSIMGRRGNAKGGSKGAGKAGEQPKESQYVKRVDLYKFLGKWMLRSYPDERGRPLMLGAKKSTAEAALEPEALRAILDADCCELLRRPTMGLNLAAASIDCAALLGPVLQDKMESLLPKLTSENFLDKVHFLNLARNVERNPEEAPEHCKSLLKKIKHLVRDHGADLAAAAEAAAGVFLGLVSILEVAAVSKDLRAWAKGVPERRKQSKHLQAWLQDPDDEDKFLAAVAKAVKEDNKNTTRARRFGDFEMQAEDTSSSVALLSSQDDSPSSSVLRASKKKRGKGMKPKKAKTSKKAKKSKQRKQASSSPDSAAQPSSEDTEPAPKKRRRGAPVRGSKTKKTRKGSSVESESAGSEQLRGQVADAGKNLCKTWSLSELQAFEEMAAQQVTAVDNAALEAEQILRVSKALPAELRRMVWERAGLLPSTENEEVLKANAERIAKHTFEMVKEVRLAWVQAAVQEDQKKTNIALLPEEKLFHQVLTVKLPEESRAAWETALKENSPECLHQRAVLLRGLWDADAAIANYNKALTFAEEFAMKEPKKEKALDLVSLIPATVAAAFGLPPPEKFERQKPANWKNYCSVAFTLAWHIFKSHADLS